MRRLLDIIFSTLGLVILSPFLLYLAIRIRLDTSGNIFYKQKRVGRQGKEFYLYKFRTMKPDADKIALLTQGANDARITPFGNYLRRNKLDELPQLVNVLLGHMSIVGPRPEVKKYVDLYDTEQREILKVRPGITDMASVVFYNESEILEAQSDPEEYYIHHILPEKIRLNRIFLTHPTVISYFRIIFLTLKKIAARRRTAINAV